MNRKAWLACVSAQLLLPLAAAAGALQDCESPSAFERPPETKDRLSPEEMELLVERPITVVREGRLEQGRHEFERILARAAERHGARSVEVADLLTSFGVQLHMLESGAKEQQLDAAISYLARAVPAYRAAFGPDHPEVAVALHSYADLLDIASPEDPPAAADAALEEAYRIRTARLGRSDPETVSALMRLARLRGLPSRTRGERSRIEAAAELYRRVLQDRMPEDGFSHPEAIRFLLSGLYARNGLIDEAIAEIRLAHEDPCDAHILLPGELEEALQRSGRRIEFEGCGAANSSSRFLQRD